MARIGGNKKRFQYCTDSSEKISSEVSKVIQDPSLHDNVLILDDFFKFIDHVGCAIKLHSIINSRLIQTGRQLSQRQTLFFLLVNHMDEELKDLEQIDLEAPRVACGEDEVVRGAPSRVAGVVQVYHRLQVVEEEEKGRKVEQEVEK